MRRIAINHTIHVILLPNLIQVPILLPHLNRVDRASIYQLLGVDGIVLGEVQVDVAGYCVAVGSVTSYPVLVSVFVYYLLL